MANVFERSAVVFMFSFRGKRCGDEIQNRFQLFCYAMAICRANFKEGDPESLAGIRHPSQPNLGVFGSGLRQYLHFSSGSCVHTSYWELS